jgi:hypothetical protein
MFKKYVANKDFRIGKARVKRGTILTFFISDGSIRWGETEIASGDFSSWKSAKQLVPAH